MCKSTVLRAATKGKQPLTYKKVTKKPLLTTSHQYQRLEFAYKNKHMNWKRVMFTDSKYFYYTYQPSGR